MTGTTPPLIFVDLKQSAKKWPLRRAQRWSWSALNGNNFRVLAVSSESYTNKADAIAAIYQLFGFGTDAYLRQAETGNIPLRLANPPA